MDQVLPITRKDRRRNRVLDPFTIAIMVAVLVAAVFPARGGVASILGWIGTGAIALLFLLHGAALSFGQTLAGLRNWRLHLLVFATTFVVFPIGVLPLEALPTSLLPADLFLGFLYLSALPSAVSGSIAFTAIARGNVPAAVCASATSNTLGLMITPFIVSLTMQGAAGAPFDLGRALTEVVVQLLLPFAFGQLIHSRVRSMTERHGALLRAYDQGVIVLIVYTAFSESIADGLFQHVSLPSLTVTIALCAALMMAAVFFVQTIARWVGLSRDDAIAAVFCFFFESTTI